MKDTERAVSYYDLFVECRAHGAADIHPQPVALGDAIDIAFAQWAASAPLSIDRGTVKVTLADWKRNRARREHYLIVNRADASLHDIPLRDVKTDKTRMAGKRPTEGIDLTCHVLIREQTNRDGKALLLMTNGTGLPSEKIINLLGTLFRSAKHVGAYAQHFRRQHPSGEAGKTIALVSRFSLGAHQNATLASMLNGANLEGLELIADSPDMLDSASPLAVTSVQYSLEPVKNGRLGLAAIQRAIATFKGRGVDPTRARVRYRPPGRGNVESKVFDIAALENAFVRKEVLQFRDPIAPRYEEVDKRVMLALAGLADRERLA